MSKCKKCGADVIWEKKPTGGFFPPKNPDGSRHDCEGKQQAVPGGTVGKLTGYTSGSATFTVKGGGTKTYAILGSIANEFTSKGFLLPPENHPDVWLSFHLDDKKFILPGYQVIQRPEWASEISDPTNGEIKTPDGKTVPPFTRASELPKETCTSPETAPALTQMRTPDPQKFTERDLFSPRDRLIVLQSTLKACADVFAITTTPDSMDFDTAMDLIIARAIKDTDTLMKAGVP
ncbi:TPA_asm: hypothetical protein vir524_00053 [Caudoviricetes sp. vir524]|jgi:hypothetical protein|nr:TPA_asm: hypothetical protein vir524_00053 [Caudoviricetes sp. vir524]